MRRTRLRRSTRCEYENLRLSYPELLLTLLFSTLQPLKQAKLLNAKVLRLGMMNDNSRG